METDELVRATVPDVNRLRVASVDGSEHRWRSEPFSVFTLGDLPRLRTYGQGRVTFRDSIGPKLPLWQSERVAPAASAGGPRCSLFEGPRVAYRSSFFLSLRDYARRERHRPQSADSTRLANSIAWTGSCETKKCLRRLLNRITLQNLGMNDTS